MPKPAAVLIRSVGVVLHLIVGYVYLVSGLVVPFPFVLLLLAVWVALTILAVRRWANPWWVLAASFLAAAVWMLVVPGLGGLLGWTA